MARKRSNEKTKSKNTLKKTNLKYGLLLLAILIIAAGSILALTSQDNEPSGNQSLQPGKWLFALDTSSAHVGSYEEYSTGYIPTLVIIDINGDIIHKRAGVHYENELLDLIQQAQNPGDTLGPAPDFTLETFNGETFKLSEHQGKVVILDIMAVRCPPCKTQMPELHNVKLEKEDDIVILSIDVDAAYGYETENDVREAFGGYVKLAVTNAAATPSVEIDPKHPKPQENVTFTATFSENESIEKVVIRVEECGNEPDMGYVCYIDKFNETMTKTSDDTYKITITLKHKNAIDMHYQLGVFSGNSWSWYPEGDMTGVDLDTTSSDSNGGNGNKDTDTPGFEFIGLLLSVMFISLILHIRKR